MLLGEWLEHAQTTLNTAGISTARLDCLVLLEDFTSKDRSWLLAHPEFDLSGTTLRKLDAAVKRRTQHEPLAYIRKKTEFYGREFYVDHRVLEPRPESEDMISLLKVVMRKGPSLAQSLIVDVGTGSGALAITAKLEFPDVKVIATDIDQNCLDVARKNVQTYGAAITFRKGNLLEPLFEARKRDSHLLTTDTILLCNLPYVPDNFHINPAAMAEPRIAIFGGPDGLDLYRALFQQLQTLAEKPGYILTEALPPQHQELTAIAQQAGFQLATSEDFIQVFTPFANPLPSASLTLK